MMLNLYDYYSAGSRALHESLKLANDHQPPTVVIHDDGWLPADVQSPLKYLYQATGEPLSGKPRYFNQLPLPHFWEIDADGNAGRVYDRGRLRGKIHYVRPDNHRLVKTVDWYDQAGHVRAIDGYNQWGWKFKTTSLDQSGQATISSYLTASGHELLVENHLTGALSLNQADGRVRLFNNWAELTAYYLERAKLVGPRIAFNSLSTPFFTMLALPAVQEPILFWQEPVGATVPDNMRYLLAHFPTSRVIVQQRDHYEQVQKLLTPDWRKRVAYLGYIYPLVRLNQGRPVALTLTNSDQLDHLTELVKARPDFQFQVAAPTEMSRRLMDLDRYPNVALYPVVSAAKVGELFAGADIYLDINRGQEVFDADRQAFLNNMAILAFNDTVHQSRYVAPTNRFAADDWRGISHRLAELTASGSQLEAVLQAQWATADRARPADYQKILK